MTAPLQPRIVQPGGGQDLHAFGDVLSVMLGGDQTGETLAVMFNVTPPGGGPPPHFHTREDELFLIVEGRVNFFIEGVWTEVEPGGAVFVPRGTIHCYRNAGSIPSRQWVLTTPSGFEQCFARCAEEFRNAGGPDMNRIVEISREHGIEFVMGEQTTSFSKQ